MLHDDRFLGSGGGIGTLCLLGKQFTQAMTGWWWPTRNIPLIGSFSSSLPRKEMRECTNVRYYGQHTAQQWLKNLNIQHVCFNFLYSSWKYVSEMSFYICFFQGLLRKTVLGDNVKWANQVPKRKSWSCDSWGNHSCHRRIQNWERLPYFPGLHPWKCSPSSGICFLVSEWPNDQLWL